MLSNHCICPRVSITDTIIGLLIKCGVICGIAIYTFGLIAKFALFGAGIYFTFKAVMFVFRFMTYKLTPAPQKLLTDQRSAV